MRDRLQVLRSLTVCDPTCGSGAFLLSALDVLESMYTVVLDRASEIADSVVSGPVGWSDVPQFLTEAENHPSDRYWLLKTICLNNLYGVDLMAEAAEIAKLRLFLKLVAQLDDVEQIEPLPDLDFNIKSGNLLIGIADLADADRRFSDNLLQLLGIKAAEQAAKQAADAYERFVKEQIADSGVGAVAGKQRLMAQIRSATTQADVALYEMRGETAGLETWMRSHVPFHWFAEFPSVGRDGGFDVVIGNPPYINKRQVTEYTWRGYATEKCPDLYAVCMERASRLLNPEGRLSMIVMHSLCFSRAFESLREYLVEQLPSMWVSSYAKRPDLLFAGSADVRNSIVIAARNVHGGLRVSRCRRWPSEARSWLFSTQEYIRPDAVLLQGGPIAQWPFADEWQVANALACLIREQRPLSDTLTTSSEFGLGYKKVGFYYIGLFIDAPPIIGLDGTVRKGPHPKHGWLFFDSLEQRNIAFLILASRWVYLWWMMYGDEFDVTKGVLSSFPAGVDSLMASHAFSSLLRLSKSLSDELPRHLKWQTNAGLQVGRYDLRECRHITDDADWLLASAWGLTRPQYEAAGNLRDRMTFGQK